MTSCPTEPCLPPGKNPQRLREVSMYLSRLCSLIACHDTVTRAPTKLKKSLSSISIPYLRLTYSRYHNPTPSRLNLTMIPLNKTNKFLKAQYTHCSPILVLAFFQILARATGVRKEGTCLPSTGHVCLINIKWHHNTKSADGVVRLYQVPFWCVSSSVVVR